MKKGAGMELLPVFPVPPSESVDLLCQKCVDLLDQLIRVGSVNHARVRNGFSSCGRASETMHADLKKELSGFGIVIQNIADNRIFCYCHDDFLRFLSLTLLL